MSVDIVYTIIFYGGGLVLLCLWIWFWGDWKKRHPGQGVDTWLWERWKQNHPDFDGDLIRHRVRERWTTVAMALGIVFVVWGLSGWTPAGRYDIGGFSESNREVLTLGVVLLLLGWFGGRRRSDRSS